MHPSYYRRPLFILLMLFGGWIFFFRRDLPPPAGDIALLAPAQNAVVEAVAVEFQRQRGGGQTVLAQARSFNGLPVHGKLLVKLPDSETVRWRATLLLQGEMKRPYGSTIPGGLDWPLYLRRQNVYAEFEAASCSETEPPNVIARAAFSSRRWLTSFLQSKFEPEMSAVLAALMLGDKDAMTGDIALPFRDSGTIHLLVASGTHVAFVLAIVYFLCRIFRIRRRLFQAVLVAVIAGFYVIAAGMNPPLVRAYVMALAALAGYALQRESGAFQGLVIAALCVLSGDNQALFKPDFQMSFLAVFAIVLAFSNMETPDRKFGWLFGGAIMTAAAQLALFPVSVAVFHRYSLVAFISNIPLIPLAGIMMALTFACVLFALLKLSPLLFVAVKLTWLATWLFMRLAECFASFSWSAIWVPALGVGVMTAYGCAAFLILHLPSPQRAKKIFIPALAAVVMALAAQYLLSKPERVWVYPSGMRGGAMMRSRTGGLVMCEAAFGGDALFKAALESGRRDIDALFLSSLSETSWHGLSELAKTAKIGAVYIPYGPLPPELETILTSLHATTTRLWPGQSVLAAGWRVSALSGLHHSRNGAWRESGYSGNADQDSLSFLAEHGKTRFEIGSHAEFLTEFEAQI